jgi:glycerol-3-phosphate acyltransferase PlsY
MKIFIEVSVLLLAYIFGSIPFGLLIVKLTTGKDIRHVASGRTGGTNAARAAGAGAGLLTALMDALKGAAAVWVAQAVSPNNPWLHVLAPIAAILGHNYSIFLAERDASFRLRLRGGAGGGPTVGGAFGLWWPSVLIDVPLAALVFFGIGYASITTISIASVITAIFAVRYVMGLATVPDVAYGLMALLLLLWALRPNITALRQGRERFHGWRPWQNRGPEALAPEDLPGRLRSQGTLARHGRGSVKTSGKKTTARKAASKR